MMYPNTVVVGYWHDERPVTAIRDGIRFGMENLGLGVAAILVAEVQDVAWYGNVSKSTT